MADRPPRHSDRRGGDRAVFAHDGDRRSRHGGRDRDADRRHRDHHRDRDYRRQDKDDPERRRYRSRSPREGSNRRSGDRDRVGDQDRDGNKWHDGDWFGNDAKERNGAPSRLRDEWRERAHARAKEGAREDCGGESKGWEELLGRQESDDLPRTDSARRRSASPRHGRGSIDHEFEKPNPSVAGSLLPTRLKGDQLKGPALSFKVKGQQDLPDRGHEQYRGRSSDTGDDALKEGDENSDAGQNLEVDEEGMDAMRAMMGFGGFGTTKGKKVAGNNVSGMRREKKTEYRQYMNRTGGFNRPLSPSR